MAKVPVIRYTAQWNPVKNQGKIAVQIPDAPQPAEVPIESVQEFIAIMLIMSKPDVLFDTEEKYFELPLRAVGT